MNDHHLLNTLNKWLDLLESFSAVSVNFSDEQQVIDARILERQQIIDSLHVLDGELAEIRAMKRAGWNGLSSDLVEKIEIIIRKGNAISSTCVVKDQKNLDIARDMRKEVSGRISNVRKSKGYLVSSHVVKKSSSIIVDSHA
ncbi:MAG: hypothetical protein JXR76_17970 [Deltaproteobacteria bacterium]|nr:hypothetical protein [Deltaproteobacteria bacterium]